MHKLINSRFAVVAVAVVALFAIGTSGAVAAHLIGSKDIKNNSIKSHDIKDNTIKSHDIKDGTIKTGDLNAATIAALKQQASGAPVQTPLGAQLAANSTSPVTTIAQIGGSFGKFTGTVNATKLDEVTLPAGTYQLSADGFFHSTAATSGLTRLQLAIRVDDGTDWGQDFGTCFTGAASALADREATCSTTRW